MGNGRAGHIVSEADVSRNHKKSLHHPMWAFSYDTLYASPANQTASKRLCRENPKGGFDNVKSL